MGLFDKLPSFRKKKAAPKPEQAASVDFSKRRGVRGLTDKMGGGADVAPPPAAPDPEMTAEKVEATRLAFESGLEKRNREIAARYGDQHRLQPMFIVSDSCWNGEHGEFLVSELALNPYGDWNILLATDNEDSARLLGAPLLPYSEVEAYAEIIEEAAAERRAYLDALRAKSGRKGKAGYDAARAAAALEIRAMAGGLSRHWTEHCRALLAQGAAA